MVEDFLDVPEKTILDASQLYIRDLINQLEMARYRLRENVKTRELLLEEVTEAQRDVEVLKRDNLRLSEIVDKFEREKKEYAATVKLITEKNQEQEKELYEYRNKLR